MAPLTACGMTVTHIDQSAESLPILNNVGAFISLHFTQPLDEVVARGRARKGQQLVVGARGDPRVARQRRARRRDGRALGGRRSRGVAVITIAVDVD